jgi:hypothetical protein
MSNLTVIPWREQTIKKLIFVTSPDKHTLRRKSKDWLARNQENVSEWRNMSGNSKGKNEIVVA